MKIAGLSALVLSTFVMIAFAPAAQAQVYRWCAIYGQAGGAKNCGFNTFDQCRAAVSGAGGSCFENTEWKGAGPAAPSKKRKIKE